jgi:cytochrome c biogenesis protein CcdA
LALLLAVSAAFVLAPDGRFAFGVESASGAATGLAQHPAAAVPRLYAFAAGMIAVVNPCGFALLPAYLGLYLGDGGRAPSSTLARLREAATVSLVVAVSFVILFGLVGVLVSAAGRTVTVLFPWVGLGVGVLMVVAGGRALAGHPIYSAAGDRMADRLGARARLGGLDGYAAFGAAYALASLGCALPIFLTVVGSTLLGTSWLTGLLQVVLYGAGMAFLLAALTILVAIFKTGFLGRVRVLGRAAEPVGAVLLLVVGAYVIYYWLTLGGIVPAPD